MPFFNFSTQRVSQGESNFTWKAAALSSRELGRFSSKGHKPDQLRYWKRDQLQSRWSVDAIFTKAVYILCESALPESYADGVCRRRAAGLPVSHGAKPHQGHRKRPCWVTGNVENSRHLLLQWTAQLLRPRFTQPHLQMDLAIKHRIVRCKYFFPGGTAQLKGEPEN